MNRTVSIITSIKKDIQSMDEGAEYQNGQNQRGIKKSSAGEVYNTLVKNFRETCALALKYIYDAKTAAAKTDELSEFLKQNKKGG